MTQMPCGAIIRHVAHLSSLLAPRATIISASSGNGRSEVQSLRMGGFGARLAPSDWHLACMGTSKHYPPFGGSTGEGRPS
jgi:hypothetical protein